MVGRNAYDKACRRNPKMMHVIYNNVTTAMITDAYFGVVDIDNP